MEHQPITHIELTQEQQQAILQEAKKAAFIWWFGIRSDRQETMEAIDPIMYRICKELFPNQSIPNLADNQ